jgi:uncharacterized protein YndB with AHSA1/START domain
MPALETATVAPSAAENLLLTQSRTVRAPRAKVYEAWTDPQIMRLWFGSSTMECTSASLDPRVGGTYRLELTRKPGVVPKDASGQGRTSSVATGRYTKVVPNELLQFTWSPDFSPAEDSLVTISLKDTPDGTEITVRHEKFLNEASRDAHNTGWANGLAQLEKVLAG